MRRATRSSSERKRSSTSAAPSRAIDAWVTVDLGSRRPEPWQVAVAERLFKRPADEVFRDVHEAERRRMELVLRPVEIRARRDQGFGCGHPAVPGRPMQRSGTVFSRLVNVDRKTAVSK